MKTTSTMAPILFAAVFLVGVAVHADVVEQSNGEATAIRNLSLDGISYDVLFRNKQGFQLCQEDPSRFPFVGDQAGAQVAAQAIVDALNSASPVPDKVGDMPVQSEVAGWFVLPFTDPCFANVANAYWGEYQQAVSGDIPGCDASKWDLCKPDEFVETNLTNFPAWATFARVTNDVTTTIDVTGDSVPDVVGFVDAAAGSPAIVVYSGATGDVEATIGYLNSNWRGRNLGTVLDVNQNGVPDDPGVAMLATNKTTNKIRVEITSLSNGAKINSIQFLNENWSVIDVVVVDDLDGDGNTTDTAIGVLALRLGDGRITLQLRDLDAGTLISNTVYLNANWRPVAAAVAARLAMPPLIGVIAEHRDRDWRTLQSRVAGSGASPTNTKVLNGNWDYRDLSVNHDANGDGIPGDTVWAVMATRASDNVIRIQTRFVSDGSFDTNTVILSSGWQSFHMDFGLDMGGSTAGEYVISATRRSDAVHRIHVKDAGSGATTLNIAP